MVGAPVLVRQPQSKKTDTKLSEAPRSDESRHEQAAPNVAKCHRVEAVVCSPATGCEQHSMATSSPNQRTEHKRASERQLRAGTSSCKQAF
jgi:hypothetical protein